MFYDGVWPQVSGLLEDWDRSIGSARPKKPSEVESLEQQTHAPSTPKHKGGKGKKEVGMYTHTHTRTHTHARTHTRTYICTCIHITELALSNVRAFRSLMREPCSPVAPGPLSWWCPPAH